MSPGPSLLIVSYQTTSFGLKNGIIFSFAHGIGIFLYAFVTAIGIGLLVIKSPILYNGIQIVGIVFLIYLSFQMLTFKMENPDLKNKTEIYKNPFLVGIMALYLFYIEPYAAAVMVITAALPVAGNTFMLAQHYKIDPERISAAILLSTLFSALTVTYAISFMI
mgnify:CR=1 FL=1